MASGSERAVADGLWGNEEALAASTDADRISIRCGNEARLLEVLARIAAGVGAAPRLREYRGRHGARALRYRCLASLGTPADHVPTMAGMHSFVRGIRLGNVPEDVSSAFPFTIPAIKNLVRIELHPGVTFFIGENGSGKSTLIEALAIKAGFNAEGGSKNFRFAARPSESLLHNYLVVSRGIKRERGGFFLRAETMFNVSTEAEAFKDYGWEDLHQKSHGEAFLWVIENRFGPQSLFILDEPEAALSPQRQLALLGLIHKHVSRGCQFIIATHSPILMGYPEATIYCLDGDGITPMEYRLTEHYAVTKAFLNDPAKMLMAILAAGDEDAE